MIVYRYVDGHEITEGDLRTAQIKNPRAAEIIVSAERRMRLMGKENIAGGVNMAAGTGNPRKDMLE